MHRWWRDLTLATRQLKRSVGFTAIVLVTLALAIGANTAIFSLVNALMLRSLPYPHPERMGTIYVRVTGPGATDRLAGIDGERWELLRDDVPAVISAVSGATSGVNLRAGNRAQYVRDGRISAHYLDVLGQRPVIGRSFSANEDRPHGPRAVILSHRLWRAAFDANPRIIGQSIDVKSEPYTVIGVLPKGAVTPLNAAVYTALQPSRKGEGSGTNFEVIARLRNGASWQEADAELNRAWAAIARRYRQRSGGSGVTFHFVPLQKGETASLRPQLTTLMASAGFILLIACANLAGLTLVRVLRRTPEVATRLALGASPWRIQRQFWAETLLLAVAGGAVGVAVGFVTLQALLRLLPEHFLPFPAAQVPLDGRVLAFGLVVALSTSVLFGMLPALLARRADIRSFTGSRGIAAAATAKLRYALIAGEVAVTVVLLAAAGLMIRTLVHLETLPAGFDPDGVMIAKASLDDARFRNPAAFRKLLTESTAAMRRIPGVVSAAVGLSVPYERALNEVVTLGDGKLAGRRFATDFVYVTPGYFRTLRMPLREGRAFTTADGPTSQHVAVVNQSFARKFYGGTNPVGHYLDKDILIVGEVTDSPVVSGLSANGAPLRSEQAVYVPAAQFSARALSLVHVWFQPDWIVRTAGPIIGLTAEMQRALREAAPGLPASGFYRMRDLLARTLDTQRIELALLGTLSSLALLLSAVGIFALVANVVAQRTREIGIRMALGSTAGRAMAQIGRAGMSASLAGVILGLLLCAAALPVIRGWLYGVGVYDAPTLAAAVLVLCLVALTATILPVLRIARIDPANTLRED